MLPTYDILREDMLLTAKKHCPAGGHNNEHGPVNSWLRTGIGEHDFLPYSVDLNPIENLWANIAREVEKEQLNDFEALEDRVLAV